MQSPLFQMKPINTKFHSHFTFLRHDLITRNINKLGRLDGHYHDLLWDLYWNVIAVTEQ